MFKKNNTHTIMLRHGNINHCLWFHGMLLLYSVWQQSNVLTTFYLKVQERQRITQSSLS